MTHFGQIHNEQLRGLLTSSDDILVKLCPTAKPEIGDTLLFYCIGMIDRRLLNEYALPWVESLLHSCTQWSDAARELTESMQWREIPDVNDIPKHLFNGELILHFVSQDRFYAISIPDIPQRQTEESNTEISLKGARDGFTEELLTNVALIRKRLRTTTLYNEAFYIGARSETKVSLLYIPDIARPEWIEEARKRLRGIQVDALVSSSQLEEALADKSLSLFPLIGYNGRPDYVVESLLSGRFVILANGSPMAIIAPINLTELIKSPEDAYFPFYIVSFQRLLRLIGILIAILLPGFWISLVSYDMDQLPFPLLATITNSRFGLPFSAPMEVLLMLGMFEVFREAGVRLPKAVGQTIAVVGGLIIGEAAIRAGLTSPTILVVSAVTAVSTFTLVNQSLTGTVSMLRFYVLVVASTLGMFGLLTSLISIIIYLSTLESFGLPYLAPLSPLSWKDLWKALFTKPWSMNRKRPAMLHPVDPTKQGGDSA